MSIYDVLASRRSELVGHEAQPDDITRLASVLTDRPVEALLRAYRDLRISGMELDFVVEDGIAERPGPDFLKTDDDAIREQQHAFFFASPWSTRQGLESDIGFQAALQAGFVVIGACSFGFDPYFLRIDELNAARQSLWRIYLDGTDCGGRLPVPADALERVCDSFADVYRVASFNEPAI